MAPTLCNLTSKEVLDGEEHSALDVLQVILLEPLIHKFTENSRSMAMATALMQRERSSPLIHELIRNRGAAGGQEQEKEGEAKGSGPQSARR